MTVTLSIVVIFHKRYTFLRREFLPSPGIVLGGKRISDLQKSLGHKLFITRSTISLLSILWRLEALLLFFGIKQVLSIFNLYANFNDTREEERLACFGSIIGIDVLMISIFPAF